MKLLMTHEQWLKIHYDCPVEETLASDAKDGSCFGDSGFVVVAEHCTRHRETFIVDCKETK